MRESVHLIWIEQRASLHSYRTHSSRGPAGPHAASGIISAISNLSITKVRRVRDKTLKKDDQKAYPEVAPHCPLSGFIHCIGRKSVISPRGGRRAGAIAPSDLTGVVQTHEITQDNINLSFMACALERSVLPLAARQICKTVSISINNHYRLRI
jgi:hypothetical protein